MSWNKAKKETEQEIPKHLKKKTTKTFEVSSPLKTFEIERIDHSVFSEEMVAKL